MARTLDRIVASGQRDRPRSEPCAHAACAVGAICYSAVAVALRELLRLVGAARDLLRHFADQLGCEGHDLLLIKALCLEVAVDRLGEDLHRTGLGFSISHRAAHWSTRCAITVKRSSTWNYLSTQAGILHPRISPLSLRLCGA